MGFSLLHTVVVAYNTVHAPHSWLVGPPCLIEEGGMLYAACKGQAGRGTFFPTRHISEGGNPTELTLRVKQNCCCYYFCCYCLLLLLLLLLQLASFAANAVRVFFLSDRVWREESRAEYKVPTTRTTILSRLGARGMYNVLHSVLSVHSTATVLRYNSLLILILVSHIRIPSVMPFELRVRLQKPNACDCDLNPFS